MNKKIIILLVGLLAATGLVNEPSRDNVAGFATRGFRTLAPNVATTTDATYEFGVVDIPIDRVGAASSSTGFEFGQVLTTSATAFTVATTSTGFAVTMNQGGRIKGCAFNLQTVPTTGAVSLMIQKNGTLQTVKYCKLPASGTFATQGSLDDLSTTQSILSDNITFVAGDRFGLIASSTGLNAATFDGNAKLILQLNN